MFIISTSLPTTGPSIAVYALRHWEEAWDDFFESIHMGYAVSIRFLDDCMSQVTWHPETGLRLPRC